MKPPTLLGLLWAYARLAQELEVVYYLQDNDKIEGLWAEINNLEVSLGIEWTLDGPVMEEER